MPKNKQAFQPFDFIDQTILPTLRRLAEFKSLMKQITPTAYEKLQQPKNDPELVHSISPFLTEEEIGPDNTIVGYKAFICQKCRYYEILSLTQKIESLSGAVELPHICEQHIIFDFNRVDDHEHPSLIQLEHKIVTLLTIAVNHWTRNEPHLMAIEVPAPPLCGGRIKEHNEYLQKIKSPALAYVDLGPVQTNHWAYRAITIGITILDQNELNDFLSRTRATDGLFEVQLGGYIRYFAMTIIKR
jgi:hypothetical protein